MKLTEYKDLLQGLRTGKVSGLCGRVIRGKNPKDFETLTDDPSRKLVMLMGSDGLEKILGKNGYEILVEIGYEPDYIKTKVESGNKFKLVIFKEGGAAKLATWDNVIDIVCDTYPDIANKIVNNKDYLKSINFDDIEKEANFDFSEIDKIGPTDEKFMTHERFQKCIGTYIEARAFLYFTIHLRELFSGDGYTYTSTGTRGLMEYIVPNKPIADLGESEIVDLKIELPQADTVRRLTMSQKMKINLVIIDPQNDFNGEHFPKATLPVAGAGGDMDRLATFVDRVGHKLNDIIVTLDSHHILDIGHAIYWRNEKGDNPPVGTVITASDIRNRTWFPVIHSQYAEQLASAERREAAGMKANMVWPPHCIIGTPGNNVDEVLMKALMNWEEKYRANVGFLTKGSYPHREHYGALMAEDFDVRVPETMLNKEVLDVQRNADIILIAGEALSHCIMETVNQIVANIGQDHLKKIYLLRDCMSPVIIPGVYDFTADSEKWLEKMKGLGLTVTTSTEFLAS